MIFFAILYNIYAFIVFLIIFIPFTLVGLLIWPFNSKIWHSLTTLMAMVLLPLLGITINVKGKEHLPRGACIITPNQLSHIDGFIIRSVTKKNFFAITEPFKKFHPLFRFWMKRLQFVDLRRTHKEDKKYPKSHSRKEGVNIASTQLKQGLSLLIFPEGHFERKKQLKHFYPGAIKLALKARIPIIPIAITNTNKIWPPDYMLQRPARVTITIGKPLHIKGKKSERLIREKTIILKKEVAKLLPQSFKSGKWQEND